MWTQMCRDVYFNYGLDLRPPARRSTHPETCRPWYEARSRCFGSGRPTSVTKQIILTSLTPNGFVSQGWSLVICQAIGRQAWNNIHKAHRFVFVPLPYHHTKIHQPPTPLNKDVEHKLCAAYLGLHPSGWLESGRANQKENQFPLGIPTFQSPLHLCCEGKQGLQARTCLRVTGARKGWKDIIPVLGVTGH